ncbi:Protein suppressor of hairy wing [Amphibalanus amphitrite]|uniref:Protein suppressor of hairy wing n=1 Tax=Amphibalanus amphitrite TaxID=1232801 RepID=A0A6A4WWZ3_AMPAM|nr:Protein suppressor of hairy wing [Amphibalanus amphitrite]
MDVSNCDLCATNALASFHLKIKEAISLVRSMSTEDKLKAVQYWNVISENLQDVVNSSADDISALQSQLCERENRMLLQSSRGAAAASAGHQPPAPRGFIIQRTELDGAGLEVAHKQSRVAVLGAGPDIIDCYLGGQSSDCGEQLAVPVMDEYAGLGTCQVLDNSMAGLKDHKRRHEGKKRFPCEICFAAFDVLSDLRRHKRSHMKEKPHKCTECDKSFPRQQALTEHLNRHFGTRPYQCQSCSKNYADRSAFNKHMKTHARGAPKKAPRRAPAVAGTAAETEADVDDPA